MLDQQGWIDFLAIVVGSMLVAGGITLVIRKNVRKPSGESHNEVAGFIFATVGVLAAVLFAFIIFALWEGFGTAERAAAQEAGLVLATARYATTVPEPARSQLQVHLRGYAEIVLNHEWKTMTEESGRAGDQMIAALWHTYGTLRPEGAYAQGATLLSELSTARTQRILSSQAVLPGVFWIVLIGAALGTVVFAFVLYMENARVHALMVALLAGILALCLWLILEVNHPFAGAVQVPKDAFEHALHVLEAMGP